MNISPPSGYGRPVIVKQYAATRVNPSAHQKKEHTHGERRGDTERRKIVVKHSGEQSHYPLEMRQSGDRRTSNRLFVTT